MTRASSSGWATYVAGLRTATKIPKGFLHLSGYAKRFGGKHSPQKLKDDLVAGKIPRRWCLKKPYGTKGQHKVFIHWNSTINPYALSLPAELRPSGFEAGKTFRQIDAPEWVPPMPHETEEEEIQESDGLANLPQVDTLDEAKLQVEKLKIMKMQAEIRLANNQTIWVEDMIAAGRQMGVELRASLMSAKNRMKSQLATCSSVQECDKILEEGLREALEIIDNPPAPNGSTENHSPN